MQRVLALMVLALCGCKSGASGGTSADLDRARMQTKKFALEGYPMWAAAHAEKACPDKLDELDRFIEAKDSNDLWGTPLKMLCGPTAPAGVPGMGVLSFGPDKKEGTPDDIRSWDK